jgi:uncharacterized membrane protein YgaE (UPF0421/DUF939 family)
MEALARIGLTLQILKIALAAGVSWEISSWLPNNPYPVFAPLAAIFTTQMTIADSVEKAIYRVLGVIGGVCVGASIAHFFSIGTLSVTMVILIGMATATAFRLNPLLISQVGVSGLLVLDYGQLHGYMQYRILETIIGALVAVIINMIICPAKESPLRKQKIVQLTKQLAQVLQYIAISNSAIAFYNKQLEVARTVVFQSGKESQNLKQAIQNLQYTPFRSKERMYMKDLCLIMERLERMSVQIRGIARGIVDIHKTAEFAPDISSAIQITATCIEQYGEYVNIPSADKKQALLQNVVKTQTIQRQVFFEIRTLVAAPVLHQLGGIFTDLSRLLDEIEEGLL